MNRIAATLALTCIASPLTAQSFQGTVTMNVTSDNGKTTTITYMLKDGKMRFDPAAQVSVIIDPATKRMMVIVNAQKMYMESDFGNVVAAAQAHAAGQTPSITRTGKMETVAGYRCEDVTITDDDGKSVTACLSSELGGFRMPTASNPVAPQREAGWIGALGSNSFPLKVEKGGKTVMEVTAIDKKALDAALFTAPPGYQAFSMPAMPKRPQLD